MLTIYYVGATFMQSWRIKKVCSKIAEQLALQTSISFYALPTGSEDGYDAALATSEMCLNRSAAKVCELLWLHGPRRGCCLRPMQALHIMPWISFPDAPSYVPFARAPTPSELVDRLVANEELMYLLLETEILPCYDDGHQVDVVKIEDYGKPIAWKIDSHLAVLIETDVEHFTKLLIATFLQNTFLINDQLPLIRIESVNYEGKPQPFTLVSSHLRKSTRTQDQLKPDDWCKHLDDLRALSVFANQATEYEYKKNRTEGKTGLVVQPDLIPHEKKEGNAVSTSDPINASAESKLPATTAKAQSKKQEPTTNSGPQTPLNAAVEVEVATQANLSVPKASAESVKGRAKPTEIKKPGIVPTTIGEGRFKTTKVIESPPAKTSTPSEPSAPAKVTSPLSTAEVKLVEPSTASSTSPTPSATASTSQPRISLNTSPLKTSPQKTSPAKSATSSSELEKIAAAAVAQHHQSPLHTMVKKSTADEPAKLTTPMSGAGVGAVVAADISASKDNAQRPSLRRNKDSLQESKPLNVLIYSESASSRESVTLTLKHLLAKDTYTIYPMTPQQVEQKHWLDNTALLVVCGTVPPHLGAILVDYFLRGGRVLSLCSDILHFVLPTYRTAEVREHELVQFSYDRWQRVQMMHHIFCYQPSPVKKNFSTDSDDSSHSLTRKPALVCPRSIELKDLHGDPHQLNVTVLGIEETWKTPSLMLAHSIVSGGKAVFSQVHLETNPSQFETDESKFAILTRNEAIRLEIFADLLSKHLNIEVNATKSVGETGVTVAAKCIYKNAYFLGRHESKYELLQKLQAIGGGNTPTNIIAATSRLTIQFCGNDVVPTQANNNVLPVLIHSCPEDFSTVDYFDNLKTNYVGRLLIYAPIVNSSMHVIDKLELTNGIAVLARQQTDGVGRGNNQWLSPLGCAMFSIQLHVSLSSPLGSRLPLLQHIVGAAMVNTLRNHPVCRNLDLAIKWPNDIYANGINKIGGLIVKTTIFGSNAIVNIGCAINLDNSKPTLCVNDLIMEFNRAQQQHLNPLKYEECVALMFNEIERLVDHVQDGGFDSFYKLYYDLWLHREQTIKICNKDGKETAAQVIGIDDCGYLKVKMSSSGAIEIVQPDGNSFDMLKGLIVPKFN